MDAKKKTMCKLTWYLNMVDHKPHKGYVNVRNHTKAMLMWEDVEYVWVMNAWVM